MKTSHINNHHSKDSRIKNDPSSYESNTYEKVSSEFSNFLADMEDLVKTSNAATGEELVQVRAKINDSISAAKASIEGTSATVSESAKKSAKVANSYVHEKPWQVIAASALIGCAIGALLARRP